MITPAFLALAARNAALASWLSSGIGRRRAGAMAALAVKGHAKADTARNAAENFISALRTPRRII